MELADETSRPVRIDVTFVPAPLPRPEGKVCIVIDALRATSTLVTMFARGAEEVLVAGSIAEARREAKKRRGWLLCGEKRSLPPRGFDYGNSPSEFSTVDLRAKRAVFVTTNGTSALLRASACLPVFAGSVLNVTAVASAAQRAAGREGRDILLQCAGDGGGREFNLEDAFCAGAIVEAIASNVDTCELNDEAEVARRLYDSFGGSAPAAFEASRHGIGLRRVGLGADVEFCAQRDLYHVTPIASKTANGLIVRAGA